ncbi:hypothetical protein GIB67_029645 [Kingdonia uniflora]|uniref:Serpin domain-containing protein n=1 Tax=Kingdonia uniflora TaxID=39325 RepID=A0A7J7LLE6_9MAGN|nr:hypothetical protein GIB67_029645 [Kingdonia uniflora]
MTTEFKIPKFKLLFGFDPSKALQECGLVFPFIPRAELDEMVMGLHHDIGVSSGIHKFATEVNEEGTEVVVFTAEYEGEG